MADNLFKTNVDNFTSSLGRLGSSIAEAGPSGLFRGVVRGATDLVGLLDTVNTALTGQPYRHPLSTKGLDAAGALPEATNTGAEEVASFIGPGGAAKALGGMFKASKAASGARVADLFPEHLSKVNPVKLDDVPMMTPSKHTLGDFIPEAKGTNYDVPIQLEQMPQGFKASDLGSTIHRTPEGFKVNGVDEASMTQRLQDLYQNLRSNVTDNPLTSPFGE